MDIEDVGDIVVDDGKPEVNELDAEVLDDVPEDDTGKVEVASDDGNMVVVVQTLPVPVLVPFLTVISYQSGGLSSRGKLFLFPLSDSNHFF
jgi:hypothetical protein